MTSILPDEMMESPGPTTPMSVESADNHPGMPPKRKSEKLLHGLQRIASSPSLLKTGRQRSSSLGSRRHGKASMSCVSLNSTSYTQCFTSPASPQMYGSLAARNNTAPHSQGVHDENSIPIRVVTSDAAAAAVNTTSHSSIPLPADMRPTSRGSLLPSSMELDENLCEMPEMVTVMVKSPKPRFEFWADMPEEIKMAILQYLPAKDLFRCSRVSKAWNKMCFDGQLWARLDTSTYYTDIPSEALVKVITGAGPFLRDLNLRGCTQLENAWLSHGELISNTCHNLVNLCIRDSRINRTTLHLLIRKNPKLVHVDVSGLSIVSNASMKTISQNCPQLEFLDISWCKGVDARGLRRIVASCPHLRDLRVNELSGFDNRQLLVQLFETNSLERLILSHCSSLSDASLKILMEGVDPEIDLLTGRAVVPPRKLKHLDLSRCRSLTDVGIKSLAHNLPDLEGLQLSQCPNIGDNALLEVIRTTPRLTHLDLEELDKLTNTFLLELSKARCAGTLQHLNLSYCERVGDTGMLQLLKSCPRIRSLDLDNTRASDLTLIELCKQARTRGSSNSFPRLGFRVAVFDCGNVTWVGIREVLSCNTFVARPFPIATAAGAIPPKTPTESNQSLSSSSSSSSFSSSSTSGSTDSTTSTTTLTDPHPTSSIIPITTITTTTPITPNPETPSNPSSDTIPTTPPPPPSATILYPKEIIDLKCFYGWQMMVNEHTKRVLRGNLAAAMRLERKWADYMMANEEAGSGGAGARRRRRRAREVERMYNEDDEGDESAYGPAGLAPLGGRRRRARSGGCVVM
ncbi:F-box domain-containing protein [Blastomyces dermatitidis ER-3]|uniref:F-box domain-containing protein n=1 Tax=Ajellomyces dermatitidis (strain ER-3 / ATCC MYA-2586) TaxID=559297 RepID=A0ABM9YF95_AJEDR|nr:F-box domain-containing protein [Blastomyces dermatitidis ER-3]EEQ83711.1 F-box domain-containing protein [Blastomyces dermatitidis ER-3]